MDTTNTAATHPVLTQSNAQIMRDHAGLVHKFAHRYKGIAAGKLEYSDLVAEGMIGLAMARRTFDPSKGRTWASWACGYIQTHIREAIGSAVVVRARIKDLGMGVQCSSMDRPVSSDEGSETLHGMLADDSLRPDATDDDGADLRARLSDVRFNDRERMILENRLLCSDPCTLQELGKAMGLTKARVQQLEKALVERLRKIVKG